MSSRRDAVKKVAGVIGAVAISKLPMPAEKKIVATLYHPSSSNPAGGYDVTVYSDGSFSCMCPAAKNQQRECKHIRSIRDGTYADYLKQHQDWVSVYSKKQWEAMKNSWLEGVEYLGGPHKKGY